MKLPRISLGSIGFTVLVLAVDFAIVRAAFVDRGSNRIAVVALLLIPMLDILMIRLYRLRRPARRTAGAIAFVVAGLVATTALFSACVVAPTTMSGVLRNVGTTIARPIMVGMARIFGNAAMQSQPMGLALGILLELVLPMTLICGPPLMVALAAGWIARRVGKTVEVAIPAAGSPSLPARWAQPVGS